MRSSRYLNVPSGRTVNEAVRSRPREPGEPGDSVSDIRSGGILWQPYFKSTPT